LALAGLWQGRAGQGMGMDEGMDEGMDGGWAWMRAIVWPSGWAGSNEQWNENWLPGPRLILPDASFLSLSDTPTTTWLTGWRCSRCSRCQTCQMCYLC
jgi:hypothetical protein